MTDPQEPGGHDASTTGPSPGGGEEMIGTVLAGRYRLLKLLGQGAMGAVYVGEHLRIGRHDAIKVLKKGLTSDVESIARFNRGARNLSAIRHPNVCTLYDYGETADGSPFLALELISGESLKDLVERERSLEARRAAAIAIQTASALDAAHHAGIVHRDLKPANIMLERDRDGGDVVKVVDFDIAKGPEPEGGDEVTRLGYVVGTPEYMSPEQLTGEKLDGRSDIYSLGVTLFRMLTGALPFRGGDVQKIMLDRLTGRPVTLAEARPDLAFPEALQHVLDRALARDRGERYGRALEFASDLSAAVQTVPARAVPGDHGVPETRVSRSERTVPSPGSPRVPVRPAGFREWLAAHRTTSWVGGASLLVVIGATAVTAAMLRDRGRVDPDNGGQEQGPVKPNGGGTGSDSSNIDDKPDSTTQKKDSTDIGGGHTDPEPNPPQSNPRLMAERAQDVLFELELRLAENPDERGWTQDQAVARAVADTAEMLWNVPGITRMDSALAAYILGEAALATRNRALCRSWLLRAQELGRDPAGELLPTCNNIDG